MTPDDPCPADLPDPCLPATLPPVPAPRAPEPPAPSARHERLLREIEQLRERLQQWQQCESRYHERIARELQPELRRWCDRLRELALRMEGALFLDPPPGKPIGRAAQRRAAEWMLSLAEAVLVERPDDAEMLALRARHQEDVAPPLDAGDEDDPGHEAGAQAPADDPDDGLEPWEREAERRRAQAEASRRTARKGRKDQAERERRERHAGRGASAGTASLREVFRRLASRLHPDREPDAAERVRKTALMQQVNEAYAAGDLLALLELQRLHLPEPVAQAAAAPLATSANDIEAALQVQRERLQAEIDEMVRRFAVLRPDLPARADTVTPQLVETLLGTEIRELRARSTALERDLGWCRDRETVGAWLRAFG
ncbi:hypothetical protein ACU6VI_08940 [Sphaerotilus natans]|uniref:hypothetical protein n=1 Tax=Sphaerotilus natans TaxID=34103 RepID=UPI00406CA86F